MKQGSTALEIKEESRDFMDYRLCISIRENSEGIRKSAYAFYNQHDFCVYRRVVDSAESDALAEYVRVAGVALSYFRINIRNRYYTEHFSELLHEDGGVVLCPYKEIVCAFTAYRNDKCKIPEEFIRLAEWFDTPSVRFDYSEESGIQKACDSLIN